MKSWLALFCLLVLASSYCIQAQKAYNRPIIGILAQPASSDTKQYGFTYIPASYVKFLESAGARVVPIPYDISVNERLFLLHQINGLLFPGGGTDLNYDDPNGYLSVEKWWVEQSIQLFEKNNTYFPIWGTCLGFQSIAVILANNLNVLETGFDSWNINLPLNFTKDSKVLEASRMFTSSELLQSGLFNRQVLLNKLSDKSNPVTLNNHHDGILVKDWFANTHLTNDVLMLASNFDLKGREFVSALEHRKYPIFATQYHPEKCSFEWRADFIINHGLDSIWANQYFAYFFVNEARKNSNQFISEETEMNYLIYNSSPKYTYKLVHSDFEQEYFFPKQQ